MNQRVAAPLLVPQRKATWAYLSLLLPALATDVAQTTALPARGDVNAFPFVPFEEIRPYLAAVGAPPLRFEAAAPPPDVSVRPPPAGPPAPRAKEEKAEAERISSVAIAPPGPAPKGPVATKGKPEESAAKITTIVAGPPPPPAILPDDAGKKVRPEDFLPFFQFPGASAAGDDRMTVPSAPRTPGQLPPSSATYQQQ